MRLSEMNTEQLFDALVALAEPMGRIGRDPALNRALGEIHRQEGRSVLERASGLFLPAATALLKTHREDTLRVIAALTGKGIDALRKQPGLLTLREAKDAFDGELLRFFR